MFQVRIHGRGGQGVDAGWVEQAAGPDARSWFVQATSDGHAKRAEAQRRWRSAQEALNLRLGTDRVAALHALLDESLHRLDGGVTDRVPA